MEDKITSMTEDIDKLKGKQNIKKTSFYELTVRLCMWVQIKN